MNGRVAAGMSSVPRLGAHVRLRFDKVRNSWTIQAPERTFMLDENAHVIVSRCDGVTDIGRLVDELCRIYSEAPRNLIEVDVLKLLQDFVDKGVMVI